MQKHSSFLLFLLLELSQTTNNFKSSWQFISLKNYRKLNEEIIASFLNRLIVFDDDNNAATAMLDNTASPDHHTYGEMYAPYGARAHFKPILISVAQKWMMWPVCLLRGLFLGRTGIPSLIFYVSNILASEANTLDPQSAKCTIRKWKRIT